jgi:flavin-binding protein dodecin
MAIVKVIEVLAESSTSWENAAQMALDEASKTVRDIRSIYVKEFQAIVKDDEIDKFRINAKISFVVHDEDRD